MGTNYSLATVDILLLCPAYTGVKKDIYIYISIYMYTVVALSQLLPYMFSHFIIMKMEQQAATVVYSASEHSHKKGDGKSIAHA